jgi:hypothetical protein
MIQLIKSWVVYLILLGLRWNWVADLCQEYLTVTHRDSLGR